MKSLLINLIVIFFFCNSLFAAEIELLGVKLYDKISDVDKFDANEIVSYLFPSSY